MGSTACTTPQCLYKGAPYLPLPLVAHIKRSSKQSKLRQCVSQISAVPVRDYVALRVSTGMQNAATVVHEYERQCKR